MEPIINPYIGEPNASLAMAREKFGRAKTKAQQQYAYEDVQAEIKRQSQLAMTQYPSQQLTGLVPAQGLSQPQVLQGDNFGQY